MAKKKSSNAPDMTSMFPGMAKSGRTSTRTPGVVPKEKLGDRVARKAKAERPFLLRGKYYGQPGAMTPKLRKRSESAAATTKLGFAVKDYAAASGNKKAAAQGHNLAKLGLWKEKRLDRDMASLNRGIDNLNAGTQRAPRRKK